MVAHRRGMKIHAVIHGPSDGLGAIADWARARGHAVTETHLYRGDELPPPEGIDFVIIMGGGMNIYQHRDHPWLVPEKRWIAAAIQQQKRMLGVCLGGQLIADVLGGKVVQNPQKEIGWFPVRILARLAPLAHFPERVTVFHWHGDTFELPPGAVRIAESEACANQGFLFGDRVVGLQFHIEVTPEIVAEFIAGGEGELKPARFVQTPEEVLQKPHGFVPDALTGLLDSLAATRD
jgi:GMP synthase (glutamine-hydrolysing)